MTEDEMAGWHHLLDSHEFEWTPGVGDGQGGLACYDSWDHRVRQDWATELNCTDELLDWVSPQVRSWATFLFVSILDIWAFVSFGHFANLVLRSVYNSELFMLGNVCLGLGLVTLGEGLWFGVQVNSPSMCLVSLLFYVKWEVQVQFIMKNFIYD